MRAPSSCAASRFATVSPAAPAPAMTMRALVATLVALASDGAATPAASPAPAIASSCRLEKAGAGRRGLRCAIGFVFHLVIRSSMYLVAGGGHLAVDQSVLSAILHLAGAGLRRALQASVVGACAAHGAPSAAIGREMAGHGRHRRLDVHMLWTTTCPHGAGAHVRPDHSWLTKVRYISTK